MAFHSFLEKSIVLLFFTSVFFGLVAVCTPITVNSTSDFISAIRSLTHDLSIGGKCPYYSFKCTKPLVRKEWYTLTEKEKQNYLNAVTCLSKKPSLPALHAKFAGTVHRLDDFTAVHSDLSPFIHFVGFFLPWHRYFGSVYENALRKECNYTGAQPYWNTAKDLARGGDMNHWGIFSNDTGFGGNGPYVSHAACPPDIFNVMGATGGGCVPGGPFGTDKNFTANIGPTTNTSIRNPRCVMRDFAPPILTLSKQSNVDFLLRLQNYTSLSKLITDINFPNNTSVHGGGHLSVGGKCGQMSDLFNSPSDPMFYMHHANLDRIYWEWQLKNLPKRLCEIGGPTVPFDYLLEEGPAVPLNWTIKMDSIAPDIEVRDLLSSVAGPLCYVYDLWS